jgi:hypothetical protein
MDQKYKTLAVKGRLNDPILISPNSKSEKERMKEKGMKLLVVQQHQLQAQPWAWVFVAYLFHLLLPNPAVRVLIHPN